MSLSSVQNVRAYSDEPPYTPEIKITNLNFKIEI